LHSDAALRRVRKESYRSVDLTGDRSHRRIRSRFSPWYLRLV